MRKPLVVLSLTVAATYAWGFPIYPTKIPNGSMNTCLNCHQRTSGGGPLNEFGNQVRTLPNGAPDWFLLFAGDADEDGFTNGEELGDPCGEWAVNQTPRFSTGITLPGADASFPESHTIDVCRDAGPDAGSDAGADAGGDAGASSSASSSSATAAAAAATSSTNSGSGSSSSGSSPMGCSAQDTAGGGSLGATLAALFAAAAIIRRRK